MGKIIKKRIEYGGSSNSAENIKYNDTKNVKEAIDEVKSEIAATNSNLENVAPIISNDLASTSLEINVAQGSSYTIPEDGYYSLFAASTSAGTNAAWYLNGVYLFGNANLESIIIPFYLKKGTVLNTRANFGSYYIFGKHI